MNETPPNMKIDRSEHCDMFDCELETAGFADGAQEFFLLIQKLPIKVVNIMPLQADVLIPGKKTMAILIAPETALDIIMELQEWLVNRAAFVSGENLGL